MYVCTYVCVCVCIVARARPSIVHYRSFRRGRRDHVGVIEIRKRDRELNGSSASNLGQSPSSALGFRRFGTIGTISAPVIKANSFRGNNAYSCTCFRILSVDIAHRWRFTSRGTTMACSCEPRGTNRLVSRLMFENQIINKSEHLVNGFSSIRTSIESRSPGENTTMEGMNNDHR